MTIDEKGYPWNKEKLRLTREVFWTCPKSYDGIWISPDNKLIINGNQWTFRVGFTWDDCSNVPSGPADDTPDLPVESLTDQPVRVLWFASMVHDACYRYIEAAGFPFDKHDADKWFGNLCKEAKWKYARLYYYGVTLFGWFALAKRWLKTKF